MAQLFHTRHKLNMLSFGSPYLAHAVVRDLSVIAKSVHPADIAVVNMLNWQRDAAECSVMMHLFALSYEHQQPFDAKSPAG